VSDARLDWLWRTLWGEPRIQAQVGHLSLFAAHAEEPAPSTLVVLPAGSVFEIDLLSSVDRGDGTEVPRPTATAVIREALCMRPGRTGRLECCPVATDLLLRLAAPIEPAAEAEALRLPADRVRATDEGLSVRVHSLNEAFLRASLRLQPHRRTVGGSVFRCVHWVGPNGRERLDQVRERARALAAGTAGTGG
jgi:hypothetical protein